VGNNARIFFLIMFTILLLCPVLASALTDTPTITTTATLIPTVPTVEPTENGCLHRDASFGLGGVIIPEIDYWTSFQSWKLSTDNYNRIVRVGNDSSYTPQKMAVSRLLPDGTRDNSFNSTGYYLFNPLVASDAAWGVNCEIDIQNRTIVTGQIQNHIAVWRLTDAGVLDSTFNGSGYLQYQPPGYTWASAWKIVIDNNGKYLISITRQDLSGTQSGLMRLQNDGNFDMSFNGTGFLWSDFGLGDFKVDSSNRIVVTGHKNNGTDEDLVMFRYNSDGSPDLTFNGGVRAVYNITARGNSDEEPGVLYLEAGDKYTITGGSRVTNNNYFTIWKMNTNGSLDTSFNGCGYISSLNISACGSNTMYAGVGLRDSIGNYYGSGLLSDGYTGNKWCYLE
jgi:uncharacterized delta-60 repeat protein